ncbi:cytochrome P450 [Longispora albida]|uniref:cytochrome P450 n=1 Tax=Longispora albida TaxID=203523 RepID=UPI0003A4AF8A|nr:cytochrome P450 [Longispora albida]
MRLALVRTLLAQRMEIAFAGYARRDPMALLHLPPGQRDPYPVYARIRARGPLTPTRLGNWMTASHRVAGQVLRDRRFGVEVPSAQGEPGLDLSFLALDPPGHTRLRRLAQPTFSPKAVAGYTERITDTAAKLLDGREGQRFDLVHDFAAPLPIAVITELLGVPDADTAEFARHGQIIGSALDGIRSLRHAASLQASSVHIEALFTRLIELRSREPRADIVSHLLANGDRIRPHELLPMCNLLLVAGFETTVNLISNCVLALLRHPAQWADLCADPAGLALAAVEETLRYDPPVQRVARVAQEPVQLEGADIRPGQFVFSMIGGTGRDPEAHDRPGVFDIHRTGGPPHLAFSAGIHYCVGAPLALNEAATAIRVLAERLPGLRLAGRVQRRLTTTIRGPLSLPVRAG